AQVYARVARHGPDHPPRKGHLLAEGLYGTRHDALRRQHTHRLRTETARRDVSRERNRSSEQHFEAPPLPGSTPRISHGPPCLFRPDMRFASSQGARRLAPGARILACRKSRLATAGWAVRPRLAAARETRFD